MRPAELSGDDSPHISVVVHALQWLDSHEGYQPDYVLLLQPTSPLRTSEDIGAAICMAEEKSADGVVGVQEAHQHPYLVKRVTEDGTLADFIASPLAYPRRQDLPPACAVNGAIYLTRRQVLLAEQTFYPARTFPYVMPAERSLQIDDPWDFHLIELILEDRHAASSDSHR